MDELFDIKKDAATDYTEKQGRYPVTFEEYSADLEDSFLAGIEWAVQHISTVVKNRMLNDYNSVDQDEDEIAQGVCAGLLHYLKTLEKKYE